MSTRRGTTRKAAITLAAALAVTTAAGEPAPSKIEALAWFAGAWSGDEGPVSMEEHWTPAKGGSMLGLHRDVKGGKTVEFEFLRIAETPGGLVYFASPMGRPATPFRLVEGGEKRAAFENKEHDFPQRILYWLTPDDVLHARIEGPRGGKTVSREWAWNRTAR